MSAETSYALRVKTPSRGFVDRHKKMQHDKVCFRARPEQENQPEPDFSFFFSCERAGNCIIGSTRGFAGGLDRRRSQTRVMPVRVEEDEDQTQCQEIENVTPHSTLRCV